ncbi:hypothetical protein NKH14_17665 [Mesorhizobium sp. M1380]|uniref:hypothetical protein n=1 Tax=Mesorhizobium sp. M1380 TaxID=2957093 RepID=UPI003338463C
MITTLKVIQIAMLTYMALAVFLKASVAAMKAEYLPEWMATPAVFLAGVILAAGLAGAAWTIHGFRAD